MIVTVTPNAALDVTYRVDQLTPHRTHRARSVHQRAGGKGVNVARVLDRLGHAVRIHGMVGGATGECIRADLDAAGLRHELVGIRRESRRTVALVADDGQATLINEPGPEISGPEWTALCELVRRATAHATAMVFAGSLPPGAPDDGYAQLIAVAASRGVPTVLDTSGVALREGVVAGPDIVKPNADELVELTGTADPSAGAAELRARGARAVVVSRGSRGLLAMTEQGWWSARPSESLSGNPTGAGDAVVAALAAGLGTGSSWPNRLRDAVALSAAAVLAPLAGDVDVAHYDRERRAAHVRTAQPVGGNP